MVFECISLRIHYNFLAIDLKFTQIEDNNMAYNL